MDTDILSRFLRGDGKVVERVRLYLREYRTVHVSVVTEYEILSGLYHKDAHQQLQRFRQFMSLATLVELGEKAVEQAAICYAASRKAGTPVDDIDLLIAGIALANGMGVATHNTAHFARIEGLDLEDWAV